MVTARFLGILRSIAILSIVILITGCGGGSGGGSPSGSAEEQESVKISGQIFDNNHNPIAYATVTITSDPIVVYTNQWGEFFVEVNPGEHTITVEKDNVILYKDTFTTEGSSVYLADLIANYPDAVPPSIPEGFTATALSSSQIKLSWSPSTDNVWVTGYQIYRDGSLLKTVTDTSTIDTGLNALTQYCYTVRAGDAAGNWSGECTQSCATTTQASADEEPPSIPTGVNAVPQSSSQIYLSWSPSTDNIGVTGYQIYRNGSLLKTVTGTSTTDTGLSTFTQYCYTVRAGDASENWSAQSAQACATTFSGVVVPVIVPNVVGMSLANAQNTITSAQLRVGSLSFVYSTTVVAGNVISQSPSAGSSVAQGTAVNLAISEGPSPVTVPYVVGMTLAGAQNTLTSTQLTVGNVSWSYSTTVIAGNVISQSPSARSSVPQGTAVDLTVSQGSQPVTVPNVVGMPQTSAESTITSAGLVVGAITQVYNNTVAAGNVISQNPTGGTVVSLGTIVALVVSKGGTPFSSEFYLDATDFQGASFVVPETGIYRFTIISGSYEICPQSSQPNSPELWGWRTGIYIYYGQGFYYALGDWTFRTLPTEAEAVGVGMYRDIGFSANQSITLLIPDGEIPFPENYWDNSGGVTILVESLN